ncbi:hypothetical protein L484_006180 [Morus notabilis]|uniref:Glabrous enhancer-binding protein-like DBD domain-containing protein n=1 Tax=Morus notabilis TaxID=981085 RepID=W9QKD4_9ROSA|nr:probable transcription factor At5g28040 [Morus notabilis]EXB39211.1 hypothetical protein L484_006180 [Morus notabilis]
MASHRDDVVLPGEDLSSSSSQDEDEDDVVDDDEDDDEELENDNDDVALPSTSSAAPNTVTVALPAPPKAEPPAILAISVIADPSSDRHRNDVVLAAQPEEKKPPATLDDSRKLFQRLWTDEDEIELLQGFLDYTAQRGKTTHHGQNDTALFYDQIKSKLQLDFNKNQLVEKLRRLKKKYRNVLNKISSGKEFSFKSPHDQATFEISRKIWSNIGAIASVADDNALEDDDANPNSTANFAVEVKGEDAGAFSGEKKTPPRSRKRSRLKSDPRTDDRRCFSDGPAAMKDNCNNNSGGTGNNHSNGNNVQGVIEETVRSCLSPLLKELLGNAMGGPCAAATRGFGGLALNPIPLNFSVPAMNLGIGEVGDERWRKQQILELEVYSKRLELVQDQIKAALDELRSRGGS